MSILDKAIQFIKSNPIIDSKLPIVDLGATELVKMSASASCGAGYGGGYNYGYGYGMSDGSKFAYGISGSGRGTYFNHRVLRQNARTACFDVPQAKAIVDRFSDTVVDIGLKLESTPKAGIRGISDEAAERWAKDVEERFEMWAEDKKSHRSEVNNFYQNQRMYGIAQHRDNDIFVRFYYSKDSDLQNPLQIEFIDPDQIKGDAFSSTHGLQNGTCMDGIERDSRGREVAYHVWVKKAEKNGYKIESKRIPAKGKKSKKTMMIHGYSTEYAGQGRGVSRLAHALQEFQNVTDFSLAHIMKAINQSSITMSVKPSKDAPASNPFEDIGIHRAGPGGATSEAACELVEERTGECGVDYKEIPEAMIRKPGSVAVMNLESGEELVPFDGKAPSDSFDAFVNSFVSFLSASVGMPIEVMLMKFNQNYSASRASLILFWRVANIWRKEMAADFLKPTYEAWLSGEIASGRVKAPGWSNPTIKEAWLSSKWFGSPMPNIDPMRTAKADQTYANMGATHLDKIARDLNGSDGKDNRRKLKKQYSELPESPFK